MAVEPNVISSTLKSKITKLFNFLDKDSNGEISWSEFVAFQLRSREVLRDTWSFDLSDLRGEFTDLDINGDGKITEQEFVGVLVKYFQQGNPGTLNDVENLIDKVTKQKESNIPSSSSISNCDQEEQDFVEKMLKVFDAADLDGDGSIDFSEFIKNEWQTDDSSQQLSTATSTSKCTVTNKSLKQLRREFTNRDLNHDGKISRDEFKIISQRCYRANFNK